MTALVCGGRDYDNPLQVYATMAVLQESYTVTKVVCGGARGADALAQAWAQEAGIPCEVWKADWTKHGRAAGPIRNRAMLREATPDLVIAFPGGAGTDNMVSIARSAGVPVLVVEQ